MTDEPIGVDGRVPSALIVFCVVAVLYAAGARAGRSRADRDGADVLRLRGEVDMSNATAIADALAATTADMVVLDLTDLRYVDRRDPRDRRGVPPPRIYRTSAGDRGAARNARGVDVPRRRFRSPTVVESIDAAFGRRASAPAEGSESGRGVSVAFVA